MLTLYHHDTSVCSQKVRLVLAEKEIPWEGSFIDLGKGQHQTPEYMKLNPNAVVPTLVHDDYVIIESSVINEYLDDLDPAQPLKPEAPYQRARMRLWIKQLDDSIHSAINTVSNAIAFRRFRARQSPEERAARLARIPDPAKRAKMKELTENGIESPLMGEALTRLDRMLADMEAALATDDWLAGGRYSLADAGFTPYVNRLAVLGLEGTWSDRPNVADWYTRIKQRPAYNTAILDHDPADRIALMKKSGDELWPRIQELWLDGNG